MAEPTLSQAQRLCDGHEQHETAMPEVRPAAPMCEECDLPMHPFAADGYEGRACDGCGWSFDTSALDGAQVW